MYAVVSAPMNHTYTDEVVKFVQAGAFEYLGQNRETIVEFHNLTLTDSYGIEGNCLIDLKLTAHITIEDSYIGNSTEFDILNAQEQFENLIKTGTFSSEPTRKLWGQYVDDDAE